MTVGGFSINVESMDKFTVLINKFLHDFKKIGQQQKIIIISILVGSFLVGILLPPVLNNLSNPKIKLPPPSPTPIPIPASLSLTSDKSNIKLGATFSATLNINSPNQGVEAADFVVNFDPKILKVATVSGGNYFGLYPVKAIEKDKVKISGIANLVNDKFIIPIGRGTIGSIVFQSLVATPSTQISFDREKTIVASKGENILDLNNILDLKVSIK